MATSQKLFFFIKNFQLIKNLCSLLHPHYKYIFLGVIGTALSIITGIELIFLNNNIFLENYRFYTILLISHALIMFFLILASFEYIQLGNSINLQYYKNILFQIKKQLMTLIYLKYCSLFLLIVSNIIFNNYLVLGISVILLLVIIYNKSLPLLMNIIKIIIFGLFSYWLLNYTILNISQTKTFIFLCLCWQLFLLIKKYQKSIKNFYSLLFIQSFIGLVSLSTNYSWLQGNLFARVNSITGNRENIDTLPGYQWFLLGFCTSCLLFAGYRYWNHVNLDKSTGGLSPEMQQQIADIKAKLETIEANTIYGQSYLTDQLEELTKKTQIITVNTTLTDKTVNNLQRQVESFIPELTKKTTILQECIDSLTIKSKKSVELQKEHFKRLFEESHNMSSRLSAVSYTNKVTTAIPFDNGLISSAPYYRLPSYVILKVKDIAQKPIISRDSLNNGLVKHPILEEFLRDLF